MHFFCQLGASFATNPTFSRNLFHRFSSSTRRQSSEHRARFDHRCVFSCRLGVRDGRQLLFGPLQGRLVSILLFQTRRRSA